MDRKNRKSKKNEKTSHLLWASLSKKNKQNEKKANLGIFCVICDLYMCVDQFMHEWRMKSIFHSGREH